MARALARARAAAEFGIHRIDAQLDRDLDGAFPVAHGGVSVGAKVGHGSGGMSLLRAV
jgi:hypothetical protein